MSTERNDDGTEEECHYREVKRTAKRFRQNLAKRKDLLTFPLLESHGA